MKALGAGMAIVGCGAAAPSQVITNDELSYLVDTSDEWITTRTGIQRRHIASAEGALCDLSAQAAAQAIEMAGLTPTDIDLIVLATSTADDLFGSAAKVQARLGASQAVAFDLTAACSGFVFALVTAAQFIRTRTYRRVVVIGADILSRWVDWSDRTTCVLFGDGAGAVVCEATTDEDHLLAFELYSDGTQQDSLNLAYQGHSDRLSNEMVIRQGTYEPITMKGREVYRFAVEKVPEVIEKALFRANLTSHDIDWLILHQANQRIMDAVAKRLKLPDDKVITNLAEYGNTSAASIPLALDEAVKQGKIQPGDLIATAGFGAGLSWGAAIFRWAK